MHTSFSNQIMSYYIHFLVQTPCPLAFQISEFVEAFFFFFALCQITKIKGKQASLSGRSMTLE